MSSLPKRETYETEPARQARYRNVVFTVNNWTQEMWDTIWNCIKISYLVMGKEVGASGTPHIQGYAEFKGSQPSWSTVQKSLGGHAWFAPRKSKLPQTAADYCKEDGDFIERGVMCEPGHQATLNDLKEQIVEGIKPRQIKWENPHLLHMFGRSIDEMYDIHNYEKKREWFTRGIWYWGPTGTGKSHKALEGYSRATHYISPGDGKWFDGYDGQEIFVINEYRGGMGEAGFTDLLQMCDWVPHWLSRRGREPIPFMAKLVIITSSMSPTEIFQTRVGSTDSIAQLERRFTVVNMAIPFVANCSESSGVILGPEQKQLVLLPPPELPVVVDRTKDLFDQYAIEQKRRLAELDKIFKPIGRQNGQLTLKDIVVDVPMRSLEQIAEAASRNGLPLPDF